MIKIICIGKIKEKYIKEGIDDYKKRITKYTKLEIIELEESKGEISKIIKQEGLDIKKYINPKDYIINLEIDGKEKSSLEMAKLIENKLITNPNITFIIGGSYGLSKELSKIAHYKLSFSKMTFPHQLFRLILLEQIYRAYKIINNEQYHK